MIVGRDEEKEKLGNNLIMIFHVILLLRQRKTRNCLFLLFTYPGPCPYVYGDSKCDCIKAVHGAKFAKSASARPMLNADHHTKTIQSKAKKREC